MFTKILIANRGEIACRIMETAKRMGITTIGVHSEVDANSLHVRMADEAYCLGPPAALESYLSIERILAAARVTGAEAIHPGYGFLSENPEFAEACTKANFVFIGPPAHVIEQMGIKSLAKKKMQEAGISVIPGSTESVDNMDTLSRAAETLGFPVLIKADRGGGGKGIRVVARPQDLQANLEAVQREAASSFGNASVILEKYLPDARHIEVQVFRDDHGNCVHLFERDCSLQRRHQKIIEEAPAPGLQEELRKSLYDVAVKAATAIDYIGAGTVEFLLDGRDCYFMEINTRLQVEHPVTESLTGLDLVEWQLHVAAGHPLPFSQEDIQRSGHAIEARLYAESPERNFLPSIGQVVHLNFPPETPSLRIDTGLEQGDAVTPHYDPLLAKIIVHGNNRNEALSTLHTSLGQTQVAGIDTNISFLLRLLKSPGMQESTNNRNYIDTHLEKLISPQPTPPLVQCLAGLFLYLNRKREVQKWATLQSDTNSPWNTCQGFRLNIPNEYKHYFTEQSGDYRVSMIVKEEGKIVISLADTIRTFTNSTLEETQLITYLAEERITANICQYSRFVMIFHRENTYKLTIVDPSKGLARESGQDSLLSPMPGKVIGVHSSPGAKLHKGEPILTLEAMKMEYTISAPEKGVVASILFQEGDSVQEGEQLAQFSLTK